MLKRAITGTVYVLSVIAAIYYPIFGMIFFGLVAAIGLWEFYSNIKKQTEISPNFVFGYILALTLFYSVNFIFTGEYTSKINFLISTPLWAMIALFISELYRKKNNAFTNIAYTMLGALYIAVPMGLAFYMVTSGQRNILLYLFIFAWCNDTFAYLTGMCLGKHKLFERISPKKTWEGFIGGLVFTIIAAVIICLVAKEEALTMVLLAISVSIIGTFGDLVESMFKRQIDIKDSGKILPGHGGILDRFDIMLIVIPFVTVLLILLK